MDLSHFVSVPFDGHLSDFWYLAMMSDSAMNICVQDLKTFSFEEVDIYLAVELLGHTARLCFAF